QIQQMRMPRLQYEIRVPEQMKDCMIPRLSLQPIVENAIVHGIELKPGVGMINITGFLESRLFNIVVDDNGSGLQEACIRELGSRLRLPLESDAGYGLWNTNQRLQLMFGKGSGIALEPSPLGGLRVRLFWEMTALEEEG